VSDSRFSIERVVEARGSTNAAVAVEASAPADPSLLAAFLGAPLADRDLTLGQVDLKGEAAKGVVLGSGKAKAEFSASAGAHGRLGVYASGSDVLADLKLDTSPIGGLELPDDEARRFAVIDWGYEGAVGGGIALQGRAAPRIEGDARRTARYIILRHLKSDLPGRKAVQQALGSWVLPSQITSLDALAPGTWVIAEVDGSIGVQVGAKYGFSLDCVREAVGGGLSGDLGLKIEAGIDVALGFRAAGRFLVAVSRPGATGHSKTIRVQVFKMKRKGWDFAMNAGATIEPVATALPDTFDGFLGGVLGIDGKQLLADLESLREVAGDPGKALEALLGDSASVQALLSRIAPGAASVAERYADAWEAIDGLLKKWDELDHEVAALLWGKLDDSETIQAIRGFAESLADLDTDEIRKRILERLNLSGESDDPVLQWVSSVVDGRVLAALADSTALQMVQGVALRTAQVLDGQALGLILHALHGYIDDALNVDRVRKAVAAASIDNLDRWLVERLEQFVGEVVDVARLEQIGQVITLLEEKSSDFYAKAREALAEKYEASFALTYKRATERTALVDVEIDGAHPDAPDLLKRAIAGEFHRFLMTKHDAVRLRAGALTHGIDRHTSVAVGLPFLSRNVNAVTRSLAKLEVADQPGGRVALYTLDAENVVERDNEMRSRFSISATLDVDSNHVRRWSVPEWISTYEYLEAFEQARRGVLAQRLEPLVDTYFRGDFPIGGEGEARGLSTWLDDWDRTIAEMTANGSDNFGNTVLRLSVALPTGTGAAWAGAPGAKTDPAYRAMSVAMQHAMRTVMLRVQDAQTSFYERRRQAYSLLVYAAIPPAHDAGLLNDGSVNLFRSGDIHWEWRDRALLKAILRLPLTASNLAIQFERVHRRLAASGELAANQLKWYEPQHCTTAIEEALTRVSTGLTDLEALLFVEEAAVRSALEAGQAMARFHRSAGADAAQAVAALAEFGERTTRAFNEQLRSRFGERALPALSTELFAAAARGLDPSLSDTQSLAMLEVLVLREGVELPSGDVARSGLREDVILAQRFVRG
jgi:hypothetical protein